MKRKGFLAVMVLILISGAGLWIGAQQDAPALVIEGATLIDGTGGAPQEDSVIVIQGDRIRSIFRKGEGSYPSGARVIRAEGKTVIPALLDIDTHIAQQGLEAAAQALSNYLYFGVTSISDTGVSLIHGEGLRRLEQEGKFIGARVFEAGPTITAVGGHPIPVNRSLGRAIDTRTLTQIEGPEDAVRQVRRYVEDLNVSIIKAIVEGGGSMKWPRMTVETYSALVAEAHRLGFKVYTHASQLDDVRIALEGGVDLLAHGFSEELTAESDIAQLMLKNKAAWLPDINNAESAVKLFDHPEIWEDPDLIKSVPRVYREMIEDPEVRTRLFGRVERGRVSVRERLRTVKVLYDLGVEILVGTDSTGAPHRMFYGWDIHREMEHLVGAGMKPMDVLMGATIKPARYLRQDQNLGSVEEGKLADLIILRADPLVDIRNSRRIEQVIFAGKLIDRDNLPMLDPFQDGLVATGKAEQEITDQAVEADLAGQFPSGPARDQILEECSGCHSLQVVLDDRKSRSDWDITVRAMMGEDPPGLKGMLDYLEAHFGE